MRERARDVMSDHRRSRSESSAVLDDLLRIAKQHEELYPLMLSTLKRYGDIFEREMDAYVQVASFHYAFTLIATCSQLKSDLFMVLDKFVEQAALLDDLYVCYCSRRHSIHWSFLAATITGVRSSRGSLNQYSTLPARLWMFVWPPKQTILFFRMRLTNSEELSINLRLRYAH